MTYKIIEMPAHAGGGYGVTTTEKGECPIHKCATVEEAGEKLAVLVEAELIEKLYPEAKALRKAMGLEGIAKFKARLGL